jgi:hypothetical protein
MPVVAQDATKADIQIPSSPGMSIIGIQNAEISKPGNYAGLYSGLISPVVSNNGTIPTDLALEFSPYYLESRDVTINELSTTNMYRDLKISIASTSVVPSDSVTFSRLGLGFRTNLLSGEISVLSTNETTLAVANDVNTVLLKIESGMFGTADTASIQSLTDHIEDNTVKKTIEKIIQENRASQPKMIAELLAFNDEVETLINVDESVWDLSLRTGHFLELAGAMALDFPQNTINSATVNRWGVWLNYTYRPKNKLEELDLGAILRISNYSFDPTIVFDDPVIFSDFGASLNYRIPKTRFTVAGEIVGKIGFQDLKISDADNQYTFTGISETKWNFSVGYRITDNVLWSFSFTETGGNSDYIKADNLQFLMGISAALVAMKK